MEAKCCFDGCDAFADFEITPEGSTERYDYTHACEDHVGQLLGDCSDGPPIYHWHVAYIGEQVAAAAGG